MGKLRRAAGLPITKFTACAALEELVEGNRRFVRVSSAAASAAICPLGFCFLRLSCSHEPSCLVINRLQGEQRGCCNDVQRREALREGQAPKAVVLTCADSRCPPELIFDQVGAGCSGGMGLVEWDWLQQPGILPQPSAAPLAEKMPPSAAAGGRCLCRLHCCTPHCTWGIPRVTQGFGDLFVIRVAGNCASEHVMGRCGGCLCMLHAGMLRHAEPLQR